MERITARNNEKIKYAVLLCSSASKRAENGEFFLEGARLCADAAESGIKIVRAFVTSSAFSKYDDYVRRIIGVCSECYEIGDDVAKKLADTDSAQGVFCICKMKECLPEFDYSGRYIALENVQDPSNLGAVCRTVEALGLDGMAVSGGCDLYNPKALRSAMGSSLRMNIIVTDNLPAFLEDAKNHGMLTLASVPRRDARDIRTVDMKGGVICCVGNEGNGLTEKTISTCDETVTIPMDGRAESLNASAAASILAWELKR